jgi:hypothetical protein
VLHGRRNQEGDGEREERQPGADKDAGEKGETLELLLEYAVELKSKQDLRSENQQAAFIKRDLEWRSSFMTPENRLRHVWSLLNGLGLRGWSGRQGTDGGRVQGRPIHGEMRAVTRTIPADFQ